jgi:hypothetical protein
MSSSAANASASTVVESIVSSEVGLWSATGAGVVSKPHEKAIGEGESLIVA